MDDLLEKKVGEYLKESSNVKLSMASSCCKEISEVAQKIISSYKNGGKVLVCGNGGSAADAQHMAAELVGWYKNKKRKGLEAIALTTDTSILTAVGNDKGYSQVFRRQVETYAKEGDVVIGLTTSGNSPNVVNALKSAKKKKALTVSLTGEKGGKVESLSDHCIKVPSKETPRIQEAHITIIHILCDLIEEELFKVEKL